MPLRYGSNPLGGDCFYVAGRACPAPTAGANLYIQKSRAQKDSAFAVSDSHLWSEWRESNSRPLEPHSSALPNCATPGRTGLSQISLSIITDCAENVNTLPHKKLRILTFLILMDYAATVAAVPKVPIVDQLDPKFTTKQKPPDP